MIERIKLYFIRRKIKRDLDLIIRHKIRTICKDLCHNCSKDDDKIIQLNIYLDLIKDANYKRSLLNEYY